MARPAVPAMPTALYSSAGKTFSMSRWAMTLPMVARRSPASTTPPSNTAETMVVPCGASMVIPSGRGRRPGSSCGAWLSRKSRNEEEPGVRKAAGRRPVPLRLASTRVLPDRRSKVGWCPGPYPLRGPVPRFLREICGNTRPQARSGHTCGARAAVFGVRGGSPRLLAALLDESAHEILRVGFQYLVDFVEYRVHV